MRVHKFLWLLMVLFFSVVGCDGRSSTPTLLPHPSSTPPLVEHTPTPIPSHPTSTSGSPGLLPDLTITDVRVEPMPTVISGRATIVRGTTYSFTFEISNVGEGSIPGTVAVSIGYGCQGPDMGEIGASVIVRGPLGPGETRLTEPPYTLLIPPAKMPGTCSFRFMVDPDNIYEESDESPTSNTWETIVGVN